MSPRSTKKNDNENYQLRIDLLQDIAVAEYGQVSPRLKDLIFDVIGLYEGRWGSHEACQTGYHNFGHAIDVALLAARMIGGWNQVKKEAAITQDGFLIAMAAALFHDSGYIKEKGDHIGSGGKYSFNHEKRSMDLAQRYLKMNSWPGEAIKIVPVIISLTEFNDELDLDNKFADEAVATLGKMVATADLVAQMADVDYMKRIAFLFDELKEAYESEGINNIKARGIKVYGSAREMVDGTMDFYENFVLPRLAALGRMDQYLVAFFGDGRNPYLENIAANLSGQLVNKRNRWRRLGDILKGLGLVRQDHLEKALKYQNKKQERQDDKDGKTSRSLVEILGQWLDASRDSRSSLGEILMDMNAISPPILRKGLIQQMLPGAMIARLSREEMLFLLKISMLLQSISRGPWLFGQILEMTNELLDCERSYILLLNPESHGMFIAIPTGPGKENFNGRAVPTDKGLAGWVFSHGRPAMVNNTSVDERYDPGADWAKECGYEARSLLAVPLHINGEMVGVMEIINKSDDNFVEHDMDVLTLLANVIAVSLDNVFRLQELYLNP